MIEFIIFFCLGYFFARMIQPSIKTDILLYWDKDSFGWRPVANKSQINVWGRYLAAFEVDPRTYVPEEKMEEQ